MALKEVFVDFLALKGTYFTFRSHQQVGNTILDFFCFWFCYHRGQLEIPFVDKSIDKNDKKPVTNLSTNR